MIRNTFRLTSKQNWDAMKRDIKAIYTAVNAEAARAALDELAEKRGKQHGAVIRLWENAWEQFIPFLDYDLEIRTVICPTNAIVPSMPATGGRSRPESTSPRSRPRSSASTW